MTYIKLMFSTFIASKVVKVLMTTQEVAQVRLRNGCCCRNDRPYAAGHRAPTMKRPVKISR